MTRLLMMVTALSLAVAPAALGTSHIRPDYEPTFERQDAWFHAHTLPIGNLDAREGRYVQWDDEAPTGSTEATYVGNNYGRFVDGDHVSEHFFTTEGTFDGDLDTIAFDMYFNGWTQSTIGCGMSLSFELRIDGKTILLQNYAGSEGIEYEAVSDTVVKARFALTNIWEAFKRFNIEHGEDVTHDVYVNIQNFYLCNEFVWFYDAEQTPSGLIANLEKPGSKGYVEIDVLNPPPPL